MIQEREFISLLVALAVVAFMLWKWSMLRRLPEWRLLFTAYVVLVCSWACSVIEELVWEPEINVLQHFCSAVSAVLLAAWCRAVARTDRGREVADDT